MQGMIKTVFCVGLGLCLLSGLAGRGAADEPPLWRHALALSGTPGYAEDFKHFAYVNPQAPRGGRLRLSASQTFDTLNPVLPKGVPGAGLGLTLERLMARALDEEDIAGAYGLLAEAVLVPEDFSFVTYRLRREARWHDGEPVKPEDVIWSFETLKELDPAQRFYYQHVVKAEKTGTHEVTFTFDEKGNRELPFIVGELLVLPKHWWEGTGPDGKPRTISASTLEPILGSGPYRITKVDPGRALVYERVPDYWGETLAVNVGSNNFDQISFDYYGDRDVEFEAFKADKFDYWDENEAKRWATGFDIPQVRDGRIVKQLVELEPVSGAMIGFLPNLRRPLFQDMRVRQALNYAYDFEEMNRTLFFGQYERIESFFHGLPFRSEGLPTGRELEILEAVRDEVPPEVFTTPYANPVGGETRKVRENLARAVELFKEAGYKLDKGKMIGPDGKPFRFELLLNGPFLERVALPYQAALKRIGVEMEIRSVDSNQFLARVRSRDFDMIYTGWGQSMSPGNEQMDFWGSKAADSEASRNYLGIKNPAVDRLIQRVVFAKDREELIAAVKALDRVLLANHYVIPSYTFNKERIAYWNRLGHPEPFPRFSLGFPTIWWWEGEETVEGEVPQ